MPRVAVVIVGRLVKADLFKGVTRKVVRVSLRRSDNRALLAYLPAPMLVPRHLRGVERKFSNRGIAVAIPSALRRAGFECDCVHYEAKRGPLDRRYSLFIGHSAVNFLSQAKWCRAGVEDCRVVYFATGEPQNVAAEAVERRRRETASVDGYLGKGFGLAQTMRSNATVTRTILLPSAAAE